MSEGKTDGAENEDAELEALRAEGDALARERIKLVNELAKKSTTETQKRVIREQLEDEKAKLEVLKARLLEAPVERPVARLRTDGLDETSASVLRRIFALDSGKTWTPERAQLLVDRMISIPLPQRQVAAQELLDQIASGELDGSLDFFSVMSGSGGFFENPKQLASQTVSNLVRQIESMPPEAREQAKKAVAAALKKGARKISEISDSRARLSGPSEETDDPPPPPSAKKSRSGSPWEDFD